MRLGLRGRKLPLPPPQKVPAMALMVVGAAILLASMPVSVYAAVLGGLIAYVGYQMMGR